MSAGDFAEGSTAEVTVWDEIVSVAKVSGPVAFELGRAIVHLGQICQGWQRRTNKRKASHCWGAQPSQGIYFVLTNKYLGSRASFDCRLQSVERIERLRLFCV
jgi:hypothetical protein